MTPTELDAIRAYHFCGPTLRDGRPIPADGEWLEHTGRVEICVSGLHASRHPYDALQYAPGQTLCLVECEDIVTEQSDKLVCHRRRIVKRIDATGLLREYARICALSVIDKWNAPDVVQRYLETGDESLRAAAWAAARAAEPAAWARAAAWAAARAAWAAARAAARAAESAAASAARSAAESEYRARFARMVDRAMEEARR